MKRFATTKTLYHGRGEGQGKRPELCKQFVKAPLPSNKKGVADWLHPFMVN